MPAETEQGDDHDRNDTEATAAKGHLRAAAAAGSGVAHLAGIEPGVLVVLHRFPLAGCARARDRFLSR